MSKCIGCGIKIQNESRNKPGYAKDLSFKYCERCFRNINYSEIKEEALKISNDDIIEKINQNSDLTFFVVDFFNITKRVIDLYNKVLTKKYLVVNKMDVIPKDIKELKIKKLLNEEYGINDNIIFTSSKKNNLVKYFDHHNIYFCGISNSGKTSLVSKITNNKSLTQSNMLNTTLDYLNIDYQDYKITDCPGFVIDINEINSKYLKIVNPSKLLKIRNYNLKEGTTLDIHDLIKITFEDSNNVSCYLSNGLVIKKEYGDLEDFRKIKIDEDSDLIILGYGFLNIKENGIIKIPKDLKFEIRKSIF